MMFPKEELWIDTRLNEEEMNFLNHAILESDKMMNEDLAGNIFRSEQIIDKDNWFYETVLKPLTEKMFYRDWENYYKFYIEGDQTQLPKFELREMWVIYQKQYASVQIHLL